MTNVASNNIDCFTGFGVQVTGLSRSYLLSVERRSPPAPQPPATTGRITGACPPQCRCNHSLHIPGFTGSALSRACHCDAVHVLRNRAGLIFLIFPAWMNLQAKELASSRLPHAAAISLAMLQATRGLLVQAESIARQFEYRAEDVANTTNYFVEQISMLKRNTTQ